VLSIFDSVLICMSTTVYFFFQAEDGIRDLIVTGVQTCALPICANCHLALGVLEASQTMRASQPATAFSDEGAGTPCRARGRAMRSEERRVGKEWRFGWWGWEEIRIIWDVGEY